MDKHGYFNFGLTCSHMKALAEVAKKVVVVVKEDMPWINGATTNASTSQRLITSLRIVRCRSPSYPSPHHQPKKMR